jgi:hypothetical protein
MMIAAAHLRDTDRIVNPHRSLRSVGVSLAEPRSVDPTRTFLALTREVDPSAWPNLVDPACADDIYGSATYRGEYRTVSNDFLIEVEDRR